MWIVKSVRKGKGVLRIGFEYMYASLLVCVKCQNGCVYETAHINVADWLDFSCCSPFTLSNSYRLAAHHSLHPIADQVENYIHQISSINIFIKADTYSQLLQFRNCHAWHWQTENKKTEIYITNNMTADRYNNECKTHTHTYKPLKKSLEIWVWSIISHLS